MNEAVIEWFDRNGKIQRREVFRTQNVFDHPESYPEARIPGARIKTSGAVYYYDVYGQLRHHDRRPEDD